jgi:hypothetical protein
MRQTVQFSGKRRLLSVRTATGDKSLSDRLFVVDRASGIRYLIDSGASVSCLPAKFGANKSKQEFTLAAANGIRISTYGVKHLQLDLGLRRTFLVVLIVADVSYPISGVDFLQKFVLLLDFKNRK